MSSHLTPIVSIEDLFGIDLIEEGYLSPHGISSATYYTLGRQGISPLILSLRNSELSELNSEQRDPDSELSGTFLETDHERDFAFKIRRSRKADPELVRAAILEYCSEFRTVREIADKLMRTADSIRLRYVTDMVYEGLLEPLFPAVRNHPKQAYRTAPISLQKEAAQS